MTLAILIGAAILLSAGYILRRQGLDTLEFRVGQIRLVRAQAPAVEKVRQHRREKRNTKRPSEEHEMKYRGSSLVVGALFAALACIPPPVLAEEFASAEIAQRGEGPQSMAGAWP